MRRTRSALMGLGLLAASTLTGCASTSPQKAFDDVQSSVAQRSGKQLRWDRETSEPAALRREVDALLARELDVDAAVQIALLVSPALRSTLEELSVAQADLVEAGLLSNPSFTVGRTAWEMDHIVPNLFASVEMAFMDVITLPLRKRVASTQLEATKLSVADQVLQLAATVRRDYFTAQAAAQIAQVRALIAEAAEAGAELAKRQYAAGTMNQLGFDTERTLAAHARLDATTSHAEAQVAREQLNKSIGLWGARTHWKLPERLPELPAQEITADHLESLAIHQRLDVSAARRSAQAIEHAITLAKTTRWTGTVHVELEAGRLRETRRWSFGPSVAVEVPLFDQRQSAIARLQAHHRRATNDLQSLAVEVRADVRQASVRLTAQRTRAQTMVGELVPLRESIVRLTQQHYDAMLMGAYSLLQAKQSEYDAYRESIEALRDYWIARSDLERAIGSRLPTPPGAAPSRPASAVSTQTVAPVASSPPSVTP